MEKITINAELLFEFKDFREWVNYAANWYAPYGKRTATVAINAAGKACQIGQDFIHSRDNNLFPVKVYGLQRAVDED